MTTGEWVEECARLAVMFRTAIVLCLLQISLVSAQLIGSRGVIKLKEGYEYRDKQTVAASEAVARYAKRFQPFSDNNAQRNRKPESFSENSVTFSSIHSKNKPGRKVRNSDIFDFQSSRIISPLVELRFNKPLQEIETERSTSSQRLLPDEGVSVTQPSVRKDNKQQEQHTTNRLTGTQRIKETVRSQEDKRNQNNIKSQVKPHPVKTISANRPRKAPKPQNANISRGVLRSSHTANRPRQTTRPYTTNRLNQPVRPHTTKRTKDPKMSPYLTNTATEDITPYSVDSVDRATYQYGNSNRVIRPQPLRPYSYQSVYGTNYYPSTSPGLLYSVIVTHLG